MKNTESLVTIFLPPVQGDEFMWQLAFLGILKRTKHVLVSNDFKQT